jgi:DNA-binding protein
LTNSRNAITLHALGRAASVAVDVAQFLCKESNGELVLNVKTSTETLIDDYELIQAPLQGNTNMDIQADKELPEHIAQFRHVSAIHITISNRTKKTKGKSETLKVPFE